MVDSKLQLLPWLPVVGPWVVACVGGVVTGLILPAPEGNTGHAEASLVNEMSSRAISPRKLPPRLASKTI